MMCLRDKYIAALAAYAILIIAVFSIRPGGDSAMPALAAAMDIASISIAVILGISAVRYFGVSTRQGKSLALLTAGLLVWLASEVLWVTAARGGGAVATDAMFVLAYPFFIAGIFYGFHTLGLNFRKEMILAPALALFLLAMVAAIVMIWDHDTSTFSLTREFTIYAFSISDAVLLIPVFLLIRRAFSGFFSRPWMLVAFALLLNIAGHMMLGIIYEAYSVGSPVDILTYFSYLAFGAAFILFEHDTRSFVTDVKEGRHRKKNETAKKREYKKGRTSK